MYWSRFDSKSSVLTLGPRDRHNQPQINIMPHTDTASLYHTIVCTAWKLCDQNRRDIAVMYDFLFSSKGKPNSKRCLKSMKHIAHDTLGRIVIYGPAVGP